MDFPMHRRQFLGGSLACGLASLPLQAIAAPKKTPGPKRIYKSVKWGMIQAQASIAEKFQLCKELGFDGMELISPFAGTVA